MIYAVSCRMALFNKLLIVVVGDVDDQPVKFVSDFELAGQAAVGFSLECGVEHAVLHVVHLWQLVQPGFVDVTVAGRARAGAPAFGHDALDIIIDCTFHDGVTGLDDNIVLRTVGCDVADLWHISMIRFLRARSLGALTGFGQRPNELRFGK